jgi:hypothetical protein
VEEPVVEEPVVEEPVVEEPVVEEPVVVKNPNAKRYVRIDGYMVLCDE